MQLMDITHESLTRQLAQAVSEVYVIIAKHSVLGMDDETIREVIDCTKEELDGIHNDPLYREVRIFIGAAHLAAGVDQTTGWDKLEQMALKNLVARAGLPNADPEFMLRVAAISNKATRRATAGKDAGVLDPSSGKTAKINLTTRLVRQISRDGSETQSIEKTLSIHDGSMANPSFDDVDQLLNVTAVPALPRQLEVKTHTPEVSFDELDSTMKDKGF